MGNGWTEGGEQQRVEGSCNEVAILNEEFGRV